MEQRHFGQTALRTQKEWRRGSIIVLFWSLWGSGQNVVHYAGNGIRGFEGATYDSVTPLSFYNTLAELMTRLPSLSAVSNKPLGLNVCLLKAAQSINSGLGSLSPNIHTTVDTILHPNYILAKHTHTHSHIFVL